MDCKKKRPPTIEKSCWEIPNHLQVDPNGSSEKNYVGGILVCSVGWLKLDSVCLTKFVICLRCLIVCVVDVINVISVLMFSRN